MMTNMNRTETIGAPAAQYECTFRPDAEGGYQVRCAAFPGLVTFGDTLEEARANAREALELCLEVYREKGWPLPPSEADPRRTIKEIIPARIARV
jgi:predicted RNase H-like HicB family nuclease